MELKKVERSTIALVVTALLILLVGSYTDNGGFRLAGALVLVVGLVQAVKEASARDRQP